uniref:Uncharacterized protein n=1 Tax=Medicago truncatula TaxID=3880 RepID=I3SEX1_MEDTR|nr:unknown [Medicago truncatula]
MKGLLPRKPAGLLPYCFNPGTLVRFADTFSCRPCNSVSFKMRAF